MAHLAFNMRLPSQNFAMSSPCSISWVCSTRYQGTKLLQQHPLCYPCLSLSGKNLRALCVNSKLIGNERVVLNTPPSSKEEAVQQVKECLYTLLEKPLKNLGSSSVKQRKLRQVKLQVEIPIIDDSPSALTSLVADILGGFSFKRKGQPTRVAVFWSDSSMAELGSQAFKNLEYVKSLDLSDPDKGRAIIKGSDVVFFVGSAISQWSSMESLSKEAAPCPVVLFNPNWSPEEEEEKNINRFLSSFETVYSLTALAIQGFFSKTEGAVFKYATSDASKSKPWLIFIKEEGKYKCVSSFQKRPGVSELENALYNSIGLNSPVTKSIKFLRGLISGTNRKK
ncbi:uncharacterized protein LOC131049366 [Cryptomeria japonica]|uniref:uncharacterized protein LOC131049366 n=1 Tax=Cryptomeria japonica TaxID=3369 RepID=UPI0027DA5B56|nr:uncharacterized protein LOC131049366 [Cryptomeria japonica]